MGPAPEGAHNLTELFLAILFYLSIDWCLGFHMIQFRPIRPVVSLLGILRKPLLAKKGEENGEDVLPARDMWCEVRCLAPSSHFATMRGELVNSLKMDEDPGSLNALASPKEPWGVSLGEIIRAFLLASLFFLSLPPPSSLKIQSAMFTSVFLMVRTVSSKQ